MRRWLCLVLLLPLLGGCYKRQTAEREAFKLRGYVSDCATGDPVAGARVNVTAYKDPRSLLNSGSSDAGTAVTDAGGNFTVTLYAYGDTDYFGVYAEKGGYQSAGLNVDKATIVSSGASLYHLDDLCLKK